MTAERQSHPCRWGWGCGMREGELGFRRGKTKLSSGREKYQTCTIPSLGTSGSSQHTWKASQHRRPLNKTGAELLLGPAPCQYLHTYTEPRDRSELTQGWQQPVQFSLRPKLNRTVSYQFSLRAQITINNLYKFVYIIYYFQNFYL